MGRAERPLDPEAGPVERFAYDLRRLRQQAGAPPYRTLANETHYSLTTLSQAASGRTLPSLPVALAFVRACGGDVSEWEKRWHEVAQAARPDGETPEAAPEEPAGAASPRRKRVRLAVAGTLVVAVAAAIVAFVLSARTPAGTQHLLGQVEPVADGSDPNRAGCGPDAVTLAWVAVHFPPDQLSGQIQLRYSPSCHAAWARFEPNDEWHPGPGLVITVWTIRPLDDANQSYTVDFGGEAIIGNMLKAGHGCIEANVTLVRGNLRSADATTACRPIS